MRQAANGSPLRFLRADCWAPAKCGVTNFSFKSALHTCETHIQKQTNTNHLANNHFHNVIAWFVTSASCKPTGCFHFLFLCFQAVTVVSKGFSGSEYVVMAKSIEIQCNPVYVYLKTPVSIAVSCFIWRVQKKNSFICKLWRSQVKCF